MRRVRLWISMLLLIALFTGCSAGGGAVRIHVTETGAGDGTGSGWGNALPGESLKIRLEQAKEGEEFWVAGGTYSPGPEKTDSFVLKAGVVLYGGFAGGEASLEERDWTKHKTILSGQGKNFHVVFSEGADGSAVLDGFTITGGAANGRQPMERSGGGMLNVQSSPAISNCVFSGNTALEMGGGMIIGAGSPTIVNCTFFGNEADVGGAVANYASSPTVINCILWGNTAKSQIHNEDDTCLPVISFSVVQGGYADGERIFTDDPLLSPLADNGGRVMTMALAENSPALYSGTPEGAPNTDARGIARPQGKWHDIGAYELESP